MDWSPGTQYIADGRAVEIDGPDSAYEMRVRDVVSGKMTTVPIAALHPITPVPKAHDPTRIGEAEWQRAVALAKDLAPLSDRARVSAQEYAKLAKKHGLSVRQLQRLRSAYIADPRPTTLVKEKAGLRKGSSLLEPKVDTLIQHTIDKHFLRREHPPKEHIVERVRSLARRLKYPVPSRTAILVRLAAAVGLAADIARHGVKGGKQRSQPRPGKLVVSRPLELIEIDHTRGDVILLSDDRRTTIGRPWVSLAIDVASRTVVGLYVTMDAPSAVSVALCIEHAVLPKSENAGDAGLWPMYGKPKRVLVDNGKDFRSLALQRGCSQHGIELSFRPVRTPHYGAHVERLIGTLMKIAHLLPGTTFSNVREKEDYDSAGKAQFTLEEFRAWLVQKICRFYHIKRHRNLGVPPVVAWERGLQDEQGKFVAPPLLPSPTEFRMDFFPGQYRKVSRTGVHFNGSRYWHDDLTPLLVSRADVLVRYNPRDPGHIWIRRPDGALVEAPAVAGRAVDAPGSLKHITAATQAALDAAMDHGFERTDAIEATAATETRKAKRATKPPEPVTNASICADLADLPPMAPPKRAPLHAEVW